MNPVNAIIFDIDGVLEYQGKVFPGAVKILSRFRTEGIHIRFLTNSTLKSRASCAEKLRQSGFEAADDEVITASYATACYMRQYKPASIWLMQDREGRDEFSDFVHDEEHPGFVVVGDYRNGFDFERLNRALRFLMRGARLIGMSGELVDGSMGSLELNVGSWVGLLERASGKPAVYIGKPSPFIFNLALKSLPVNPNEVLVVGDRVSSDILGARQAGLRSALVKTGEFLPIHLAGSVTPDWILEDIYELPALVKSCRV